MRNGIRTAMAALALGAAAVITGCGGDDTGGGSTTGGSTTGGMAECSQPSDCQQIVCNCASGPVNYTGCVNGTCGTTANCESQGACN